jgi:hypothetical protein
MSVVGGAGQQKSRLAPAFLCRLKQATPVRTYFGAGFLPLDFFFVATVHDSQERLRKENCDQVASAV